MIINLIMIILEIFLMLIGVHYLHKISRRFIIYDKPHITHDEMMESFKKFQLEHTNIERNKNGNK
jgi:hypothetical protein